MSEERCLGCDKRPEVYGSSWCSNCDRLIPFEARARMIQMRNLILQADPWVQTRMHKHQRQAANDKREYYRARHAREADYCEGWLAGAAHFVPYEHLGSAAQREVAK